MRFWILLVLALSITGWGQSISVIMEPLGESVAKRTMGTDYTLWRVYPSTSDLAATSIPRSSITSITPIAELPSAMARDLVTKGAGRNAWTLLGKGWDGGAPLASGVLNAVGVAAKSRKSLYVAGGITVAELFRNLLRGQAPTPALYAEQFLPDTVPCSKGDCGEYYVLTGRVKDPVRVVLDGKPPQPTARNLIIVQPEQLQFFDMSHCPPPGTFPDPCSGTTTISPAWGDNCGCRDSQPCGCNNFKTISLRTHPDVHDDPLYEVRAALESNPSEATERAWREKLAQIGASQ